ncbi:MAG: hypothetical protein R2764_11855 [Bacteroidales bacterium]
MQNEFIWGLELCASLPPANECEDFDDLTVGGYVAGQLGGNWTIWGGARVQMRCPCF